MSGPTRLKTRRQLLFHCAVSRLLLGAFVSFFVLSCDGGAISRVRLPVPGKPALSMYGPTVDNCEDELNFYGYPVCHGNDVTYSNLSFDCPSGCHTYPMNPDQESAYLSALNLIPNNSLCGWARTFITQMYRSGRIRVYDQPDMNSNGTYRVADQHSSSGASQPGPDWQGPIHLWSRPLADSPSWFNAQTLVHEAYHGYHNSGDETAAENAATNCVPAQ